ncbi:conserved hypothetical protein [Filimonas lacunae]|uniref:Glycosyl transferase family 28 C-terminal domain-containing protein n=1 Tax=Filimonas lacunae TaxID=477680 RepID=A0A173MPL4_9BACT|nr:glycosyltransferase [Filimonas lacunae]BAV09370.1 UDP-N-acetylglucosamine-N-acetylmuramyl-(pentapeptide) pyrophosphoryl-undecaprenol N-acetylglucosamine transferase [Filimonas lacunae]SIS71926.1 conserved hypothetical protein [Filimonas lacunae]
MTKISNISVALVAPLDWGLGHTTRCIPVIHQLQQCGYQVFVAAEGAQVHLLQQEFPGITILPLRGYRIQYTQHKRWLALKILQQLPKIIRTIRYEHIWLQKQVKEYDIQLVISDNRFGFWHKRVTSIFITHQLSIQAPFAWVRHLLRWINYRHIQRYNACWIPDMAHQQANIAGSLSHPRQLPAIPTRYIGPLSRFTPVTTSLPYKYKWLFILSGPEPQRSLLETKLLSLVDQLKAPVLLLRAKPGTTDLPTAPANCTVVNHLASTQMQQVIAESEYIVSRSGYTTVMELLSLQKKAVLIPTPGQTEQEYLATRLQQQHWSYCCNQQDDLLYHFNQALSFTYQLPVIPNHQLEEAISNIKHPA